MTEKDKDEEAIRIAVKMLKKLEGFSSTVYLDVAGIKTIGYGFTDLNIINKHANGMTEAEACSILIDTLRSNFLPYVKKPINSDAYKALNSNQLAALLCFVYNIGGRAFAGSTVVKLINNNAPPTDVVSSMSRWVYAGKKKVGGLVNRRRKECELYVS